MLAYRTRATLTNLVYDSSEAVIGKARAGDDRFVSRLEWDLETARATYDPADVEEAVLARYAGRYANRTIALTGSRLVHTFRGLEDALLPITQSRFVVNALEKLEFVTGEEGTVTHLVVTNHRGHRFEIPRE